jgi:hypothetical protein
MAANVSPIFALVPEVKRAIITLTTTDKSGATPANLVELVTGATDGTKVTWIKFKHVGNSTAGLYLIFITDTSGLNPVLYAELVITAITSAANVATHENIILLSDLQLKSGQKILVGATTVTSNIHVTASVGDF